MAVMKSIDPADIAGYGVEETTHMGVAVAVASGAADVGLGVRSAARALGVDFVPVTTEDYDLLIPEAFWEHPGVAALREVIVAGLAPDPADRPDARGFVERINAYLTGQADLHARR